MTAAPPLSNPGPPRRLAFCCELAGRDFLELCAKPGVRKGLARLGAEACVGLVDLSEERARGVRLLHDAGIRTSAWLLLPREDGYWHHGRNAAAVSRRFDELRIWSERHGVTWSGLDLDFEPAWDEMHALTSKQYRRLASLVRRREPSVSWEAVITRLASDGHEVSSFVAPVVIGDRRTGAMRLHRLLGLPDVRLGRERVMLYSSLFETSDGGFLASFAPECKAIAIGSTGGGIAFDGAGELRALGWDELSRDLRIARAHADDLTIFSLEGCVRQRFLDPLADFDWTLRERPSTRSVDLARRVLGR